MNLAIIGAGDHSLEIFNYIIDDVKLYKTINKIIIIDYKKNKNLSIMKKISKKIFFLNNINKIKKIKNIKACISFGEPRLRENSCKKLKKNKIPLLSIVHKTSYISRNAIISDGVIIAPNCVVAPYANLKENVLINSGAIVGHHSTVDKHTVMSPNSFIGGHSRIGKICFLGANSSIMPKVSLNDSSRLSASSVLYRNTEKFTLSHGNPAKTKKLYK